MIIVIGMGADGMAGLSPQSRSELLRAKVIYGSSRQLALLDAKLSAHRRQWPAPLLPALSSLFGDLAECDGDVHVLASGDPMLHGIGVTLVRLFGAERVKVLPHISAVTLARARMSWTDHNTEVINLVTAPPHTALRRGGQAIVLSRDAETPVTVARLLATHGRGKSLVTVLEQLGGPRERRRDATAADWAARPPDDIDELNVLAVRYLPDERLSSSIPDDLFDHDGQITKQSMRALTLAALAPRPGERLWDVGSGSGSVAIEWGRSGSGCTAVAFEKDIARRARITRNAIAFGVNIDVRGEAPNAFDGAAAPAAIFVGGGLTQHNVLDACLRHLPMGGRLVANAVTAESEILVTQAHRRFGGTLQRFQHYHSEPLGGFTAWRPQLPITQWSVTRP
ncbi:MAG: precorrin-6y C5,15-methyltransferase (decarboxylating) subunit CbiE [Mycobacteriaceae bacterium]|nr:precorrin-6y C5,15-methyltransferase (decarboxylating) subunit CbiE [Mycobacteriaceae bacterium]